MPLPQLHGHGATVLQYVEATHRAMHELCGIGPTVGFAATGRAARAIERMLLIACRERRGLTIAETAEFETGLKALRAAAHADSAAIGLALE